MVDLIAKFFSSLLSLAESQESSRFSGNPATIVERIESLTRHFLGFFTFSDGFFLMALRNFVREFIFALSVCVSFVLSSQAMAQRSGGSELDLLRREEIRTQLGLSQDQITKLEEFQQNSNPGREVIEPFMERLRSTAAGDEEARNKIREEMNAALAKARSQFQDQAGSVLTVDQKKALRSLYISNAGIRALTDDRVATDLGLTDEQKQKLETLNGERRTAAQAMGFNATDEQRTKFDEEWKTKFLEVLTADQKKMWEEQSVPVPAVAQAGTTPAPGTPASNGAAAL